MKNAVLSPGIVLEWLRATNAAPMSTLFRILALIVLLYLTEGIQKAVGQPMKQTRGVKFFENVVLETSDHTVVRIHESKTAGIAIKADAGLIDKIKTSVTGTTLTVHLDDDQNFDTGNIEICIQLPILRKISLNGGGFVQIVDNNLGADLETSITGGGRIKFEEKSRIQNLDGRVSGGGTVEALNLTSEKASVLIVGGGEVMLQVHGALEGKIIGGGNILYDGDPRVSSQISGGGRVARRYSLFPAL
jgi:hypothetical protein